MAHQTFEYKEIDGGLHITGLKDKSLSEIEIPATIDSKNVTAIASNAFAGCNNLKKVKLPDSLVKIGEFAFFKCSEIEDINLDFVQCIGLSSFQNCKQLKTVTLARLQNGVGNWAFYGCENLEQVSLGDRISHIGHQAFALCENLKRVVLLSSKTITLGNEVFFNVRPSCKFVLPFFRGKELLFEDISQVADFDYSETLDYFSVEGVRYEKTAENEVTVAENKDFVGTAFIYPNINFNGVNFAVTSISEKAFFECKTITSVNIPSTIKEIGQFALSKCESLASINVQNNNFYYSTDDALALVRKSDKSLIAFALGSKSVSFDVPIDVRKIDKYALYGFRNLKHIVFDLDITATGCGIGIDPEAFADDDQTKRCVIFVKADYSEAVRKAYEKLLEKWWKGENVKLFGVFTDNKINYRVIDENEKKAEVTVNKNTTPSLTIKGKVDYAGVTYTVTRVGNSAFYGNSELTEINLPDSIVAIGNDSFHRSALTRMRIPKNVDSIGINAFKNAMDLKTLKFTSSKAPKNIGKDAFYGLEDCTIKIPKNSSYNNLEELFDGSCSIEEY